MSSQVEREAVSVNASRPYPNDHSTPMNVESYDIDPRALQRADLVTLVDNNANLQEHQKKMLCTTLVRYLKNLTTKPGKCNVYSYKFQVEKVQPIASYARPIPFHMRSEVRQQICNCYQMI